MRLNIDFSQPYKTLFPDSLFVVEPNGHIYLPIALQGIDQVKGMVLFNDAPLEGVIVKLVTKGRDLIDTTNQTGDFHFVIPESLQSNEYKVWFIKQGFRSKSAPAFPETGEPLEIVMEKK